MKFTKIIAGYKLITQIPLLSIIIVSENLYTNLDNNHFVIILNINMWILYIFISVIFQIII